MHRRGEASEGTLPKATRRARKRVRSPYRAVGKCCQCGNVASPNVANFQFGAGYGVRRIGLVYYSAEGKLRRRQDAGIAVRRTTGTGARTAVTFCLVVRIQGVVRHPCFYGNVNEDKILLRGDNYDN